MNKDMICPVCNARLRPIGGFYDCPNDHRTWAGTKELWQELIKTKQKLDTVIEHWSNSSKASNHYMGVATELRNALTGIFFICEKDANKDANARISEIYTIAKKVLEHKE